MGKLALAAKITHVPSMYLSELPGKHHGCRQAAIDGHKEIGRRCRALGVDTIVVAGCNLPNCPRATLFEASERDFRTVAFLLDWWLKSLLRQGATGEASPDLVANEGALRQRLLQGAGLDRWMQVWEKVAHLFARADAVNLDRKQVILGSLFAFQSAIR